MALKHNKYKINGFQTSFVRVFLYPGDRTKDLLIASCID
jgi:hypothetical protein